VKIAVVFARLQVSEVKFHHLSEVSKPSIPFVEKFHAKPSIPFVEKFA